ncbi:MAG TPA: PAS domain S-box protein [Polyangiaceae bacterium]|nr:PAS domain S-box protein [Polyangiaceae bacterium]
MTGVPESLYEATFELAPNGVMLVRADGVIVLVNTQMASFFGYERDELLGQRSEVLVPERNRGRHEARLEEFRKSPHVRPMSSGRHLVGRRKDGTEFPVDVGSSALEWEGEQLTLLTATDVSKRTELELAFEIARDEAEESKFIASTAKLERELAERHLMTSRAELLETQRVARLGSWITDVATRKITWSDEIYRILGVAPGALKPTREALWQHVYAEDRVRLDEQLANFRRTLEPFSAEARVVRSDGKLRYLLFHTSVFAWRDGVPVTIGTAVQDVTVQKQSEIALREQQHALLLSERRFRALVTQAPIGIFETDTEGRCVFVNERWEELAGVSYERALDTGWLDALHPDDTTAVLDEWAWAIAEKRDFLLEFRYRHVDGRTVWVAGMASAMSDNDGRVTGYLGTIQDITERRIAADKLRETLTLWRGILDSANYAIIATMPDGIIREWNIAAERMLGYSASEVIGVATPAIIHLPSEIERRAAALSNELREHVAAGFDAFAAKARRGAVDENEWTYVRKDGTRFPVLLSMTALRDNDGVLTGYLGVASDVTERKRQERELIAAKEAAEQAARAKSDFLARMSHEIRTPMNGVIGMTALALKTELSDVQRDYLRIVESSANGLLHIINDILDFSRAEVGKLSLERTPFALRESVGRGLRGLALGAEQRGVELVLRLPDTVPDSLVGDPHRLQQVLINLVSNALKFTEHGEVVVAVSLASEESDRVRLEFSVEDTGAGIDEAHQLSIFDAFTQADASVGRKFGGTGLGLAICSELVELMGGQIGLRSELGKGSRFFFEVPFERVLDSGGPHLPMLDDLSVLIVEDHETTRRSLVELFLGWRMRPFAVENLRDACVEAGARAAAKQRFELLVVDAPIVFQDQDAWATLQRQHRPPATVLLVPASGLRATPTHLDERSSAQVAKPVVPSELLAAVERLKSRQNPPRRASLPVRVAEGPRLDILVAEDNAVNQYVIKHMVALAEHRVTVVDNGRQALDELERKSFDVVLMDLEMPELGGLAAVELLRKREAGTGRRVPVVALTAQAMAGDRERCLAAGMDDYVAKPLDMEILYATLRRVGGAPPRPTPAPVATSSHPAFDRETLLARIGDAPAVLSDVARLFRETTARLMPKLSTELGAEQGDAKKSAHELKGMLLMLSATEAAESAKAVELHCKSGDWQGARAAFEVLGAQVDRVGATIRALCH